MRASEESGLSRMPRVVWVGALLTAVILANVATFGWIERRYVTPSYRAFDPGGVPDMRPSSQPSRWLRDDAMALFELYLQIGEIPGRTVVAADGVVPDPQLLFGLGRVDELVGFDGAGRSVAVDPDSCVFQFEGVDKRLGPYDLCVSDADRLVMFRDDGVVVIRDAGA